MQKLRLTSFSLVLILTAAAVQIRAKDPKNQEVVSRRPVNDGKWHHVVVTRNGATELKMYLDGKLSARATIDAGTRLSPRRNTTIGSRFPGGIDDVMIWRRGLSEAEVKELYKATTGR